MIQLGGVQQIVSADIDGDTDIDILYGSTLSVVAWLENIDGQGSFNVEHIINTEVDVVTDVFVTDLNNDNSLDVLHTTVGDTKISWQENLDGLGAFGERKIIEDLASISIVAVDIDGDGYKDVVTKINQSQVVWYKNLTYLGVDDNNLQDIALVPNPTKSTINIKNSNAPINNISIYNVLGVLVLDQNNNLNSIDISSLQTGLYFVKIKTIEGLVIKKVVKE